MIFRGIYSDFFLPCPEPSFGFSPLSLLSVSHSDDVEVDTAVGRSLLFVSLASLHII